MGQKKSAAGAVPTTSLDRAFAILELASQKPGGLTNADVRRRLGVPTSSCCYVLDRLEQAGYLRRSTVSRRYELGLKVLTLAHGALRDIGLRVIAEPVLHEIAADTGFSSLVGILQDGKVLILDKIEQPELVGVDFEIGVVLPAHATAVGKVLLAHLSPAQLKRYLASHKLIKRSTNTIDSPQELMEELESVRRQGYSSNDGELFPGMRALAAPIFDSAEEVCAAVSLVGTKHSPLEDPAAIRIIKSAASKISVRLAKAASSRRSFEDGIHALSALRNR